MDIVTLTIYAVSYLLIPKAGSFPQKKDEASLDATRIPVATLALCSYSGKTGEAYDVDVQTLPRSEEHNLLTLARHFKVSNPWPDNSESGEPTKRNPKNASAINYRKNRLP